jgi:hypothetical protein
MAGMALRWKMPKAARNDTPGVMHHIMIRGIERRLIFKCEIIDRLVFCSIYR